MPAPRAQAAGGNKRGGPERPEVRPPLSGANTGRKREKQAQARQADSRPG